MSAVTTRLTLVGGGPSSTYVLERLAATAATSLAGAGLEVHVFDRAGRFGAGEVHSPDQPVTSFLNRIVGQVAFAADESVVGAGALLDAEQRPTLLEWCRRQFARTGDPAFDLRAEDWPKRYVHGLALRDAFDRYVALLRAVPGVSVHLHVGEVHDVEDTGGALLVRSTSATAPVVETDHVLLLTGHSSADEALDPRLRPYAEFAARHARARYVGATYPLEQRITAEAAPAGSVVGCLGMGLSAIDVILHLTEGRGGRFEVRDGRTVYVPSGAEPQHVVVFSNAGIFTFARPFNAKEVDPERLEHRGVFLTERAVDRLRAARGRPMTVGGEVRRQLDFDADLFPLVLLEMAYLHYRTLLGTEVGDHLIASVTPAYEEHLDATPAPVGVGADALLGAVERAVGPVLRAVDVLLAGGTVPDDDRAAPFVAAAAERLVRTVYGPEVAELLATVPPVVALAGRSPRWGHPASAQQNRFSWQETIDPVPEADRGDPDTYARAVVAFMRRDHLWAAQSNVDNPAKAAADGVWRDLRDVLAYAIDFGGLTARSHERFLRVHMRHHNRLANGAALEVMERVLALVEAGVVVVGAGPRAEVVADEEAGRFRVVGPVTGARFEVDVLVDGRVHAFDPETDVLPLYRNLLARGLVRTWANPSADGGSFAPGGLDLTPDFHPLRADGTVDERLTLLGPPSEGVMFFQLGALRPHQNHHVMQDVIRWLDAFWRGVRAADAPVGGASC